MCGYSWRVRLSIVVPTYNERTRLGERRRSGVRHDGSRVSWSSSTTARPTHRRLADDPATRHRIRWCTGRASSARHRGHRRLAASGEILGVMDADPSHPPSAMLGARGARGGNADMAIGSRYVPGGGVRRP
jgi:dolichol-phosphate mannosyltransferase